MEHGTSTKEMTKRRLCGQHGAPRRGYMVHTHMRRARPSTMGAGGSRRRRGHQEVVAGSNRGVEVDRAGWAGESSGGG
jgi:hypothetical protein